MSRPLYICGQGEHDRIDPMARCWALPWSDRYWAQAERLFEMHDRRLWEMRGKWYLERLQDIEVPIIMHTAHADVPTSRCFPFEHPIAKMHTWFDSSIAYMLAYAIFTNEKRIIFAGVNVATESEFVHEQPCLAYWCGVAAARGIELEIPAESDLLRPHLKNTFIDMPVEYDGVYGRLPWTNESTANPTSLPH